jgi:hypothetical protein
MPITEEARRKNFLYRQFMKRERWDGWWEDTVPSSFRSTFDPARLDEYSREAAAYVLGTRDIPVDEEDESIDRNAASDENWDCRLHLEVYRNLYLFGPSGAGKTRACWEFIRRYSRPLTSPEREGNTRDVGDGWDDEGAVALVTASHMLGKVSSLQGKGVDLWVQQWAAPQLLVVDDLGHRITSGQADALLELLRTRLESDDYTTFFTSNFSITQLVERWRGMEAAETLQAIVRRIRDYCVPVSFVDPSNPRVAATPEQTGKGTQRRWPGRRGKS